MKDIEIIEAWAKEMGIRTATYPQGRTTTEAISYAYLQELVRAAIEADRAQRVPDWPAGSYLSWGGFNIYGDEGSIKEVKRLMHEAGTVPDLKAMLAESYKELAKATPELCDPSCATHEVAAMVMSDCGHSTNNQRLLDRIAARIDKHVEALLASTPAPAQQECWCEKCDLAQGNPLGRTRMSLCPECGDKRCPRAKHHDNACAQHQEPHQQERKPMTDEQDRALCEAFCNAASDEYFKARPQLDSDVNRRIFYAGHRKAWLEWQTAHGIKE